MADALNEARVNQLDRTSIDTSLLSSVNSLTDVLAYDQDYTTYCGRPWHFDGAPGEVTIGLYACISLASAGKCEKSEIRFDLSYNDGVAWNLRNSTACHEVGHTVGLLHRNTSDSGCIATNNDHYHYSEHDVAHINGGPPTLGGDTFLYNGQSMFSWDGHYRAYMQPDGNFVVYNHWTGGFLWASNTNGWGNSVMAKIQSDGNFVLYVPSAYGLAPICSTRTSGQGPSHITMQTDGNLVIYRNTGGATWSTQGGGKCT